QVNAGCKMSLRSLTSNALLAAIIALLSLSAASAQGRAGSTKTWTSPRTPWGDPDLTGIWNNATSTPLQRPTQVEGKPALTDEEAAEFAAELAHGLNRDRRDGGSLADVNRAYNEHWMDAKRLQITADKRTSLIIDPPDGKTPALVPLSPERQKRRAAVEEAGRRFNSGMPDSPLDAALPMRCIIRTDRPP